MHEGLSQFLSSSPNLYHTEPDAFAMKHYARAVLNHRIREFDRRLESSFIAERSPYSSIGRIAPTELSFHKAVDPNPQADTESCHTALQLVSVESSVGQAEGFDTDKFAKPALHLDADLSASHNFLPSSNLDLFFPGGSPKQGGAADMSPSKSSDTPETEAPPTAKATIGKTTFQGKSTVRAACKMQTCSAKTGLPVMDDYLLHN